MGTLKEAQSTIVRVWTETPTSEELVRLFKLGKIRKNEKKLSAHFEHDTTD